MKRFLPFFIVIAGFAAVVRAQEIPPSLHDSLFSTYYQQRVSHFRTLPLKQHEIVFLGNSITDFSEWSELFDDPRIINRGISGDMTAGILNRLDEVVDRKPAKIFLLIGTNDLEHHITPDSVLKNIFLIARIIHKQTPLTRLYVQSITPVNSYYHKFPHHTGNGALIAAINRSLQANAGKYQYIYIDIHSMLADKEDKFDIRLTNDGLHMKGDAYERWKHKIFSLVYDLQEKPSLVPLPQKLSWNGEYFPLYKCRAIVAGSDSLRAIANDLQEMIRESGFDLPVLKAGNDFPFIELKIGRVEAPRFREEAYRLVVDTGKISLTANTVHGLFNGMQTLRQLMRAKSVVEGCRITDWPAFSWRGYMVDVGRNYQSVGQLRQQIDVMAQYKLNVFHFHPTENIAWRLQIWQYPQLTAPVNMQRDKGQYYSIADMKDLIRYCRERFITFVPEIDMPGHSDAFTRAFGLDMQTEKGLAIVKNILSEVCETYDVPYIHIGADEVKVTYKNFIPEVVKLIRSHGKQTIGWDPGGNYDKATIRQLWKGEGPGEEQDPGSYRYIDSRNLYLNHMDPLSGVVTIFNRRIGGVARGDGHILGGEICVWNDTRAKNEGDILLMNGAYPDMLAFAERSWRGGGDNGFRVDIGYDTTARAAAFASFEKRLLDQKRLYFRKKPFPYVRQSDIHWKLFGPFDNNGDATTVFWPEKGGVSLSDSMAVRNVSGGTIWLRHFFAPRVTGWLTDPAENTTWYGYTRFYSASDTTGYLWIGFYNPSRSHVVSTPREGSWDKRGSRIWLNGKIIPPPHWARPGRDGSPEAPLIDEDYEYRMPAAVHFRKGWNEIRLKLPVESFSGKDLQHPVKWMFTVVPVHKENGINWYADEVKYQAN